jgi:hypothetical protein
VVPQAETAWLYKIAGNVCLERQRRSRRRPEIVQNPATLERSAPSTTNGGDELLGLDDALQRLAPRQRRALLLREWHGLSYREIAAELQLSPAAVETLLFRARRSLAQNLDSPQRLRSRRRVPGLQAGSLVAWLKSLLGGVGSAEGRGGGCRGRRHGLGRERTSGTRCASAGGQVDSQTRRHGDHRVAAAAWSIPPSFGGGCCKTRGRAASGTDRPPRQATDACAAHLERRCADDAANGCHACEQTDAGTTG